MKTLDIFEAAEGFDRTRDFIYVVPEQNQFSNSSKAGVFVVIKGIEYQLNTVTAINLKYDPERPLVEGFIVCADLRRVLASHIPYFTWNLKTGEVVPYDMGE